jgi:hypothetical protein
MDGLYTGAEGPAYDLPVIQVKNHRQIHPTGGGTQAGDVGPLVCSDFGPLGPKVRSIVQSAPGDESE